MNISKYCFSFLLSLIFISAGAQESLSLADAIQKGLQNNYQIKISKSNLEIAQNNNSWGEAGLLPSISLSAVNANRYDDGFNKSTQKDQAYSTYSFAPGVSLNWLLFGGFAVQMSKKNLELLEANSESSAALVVENTIQAIILAYYKVLLEKEKLDILESLMKLSRDRYDYTLEKKKLGSAVTYDLLQAQNSYLSDSSTYLLQKMALRTATMNFNLLLAEDVDKSFTLTDEFTVDDPEFDQEDLKSKMLSNNKTLRNQYINQSLLANNIKLAKSGLYPSLSMSSGYDMNKTKLKLEGYDPIDADGYDYYVNFSLNFNLFNGGKTRRAISNAKISEDIGNLQLEELKQSMNLQLATTLELYNIRKQLLAVADENIKSTKLNLDISAEKFENGSINSFNYRDIQLLYLNTAFDELEAKYNLIESKTDLLRLAGGIISEYE